MSQFTQDQLQLIRKDINTALKAVGEKHGLKFDFKQINYGETDFSTKLTAHLVDGPSPEESLYSINAERYDLPPLGSLLSYKNEFWEICGWLKSSRKYCILCNDGTSKMKFTINAIRGAKIIRKGPKK